MSQRPKILYAVQATGNGHLSRCLQFQPVFAKYAEVDVLLSGIQGDLELPFSVKYRYYGWGYVFGKNGGVDIWGTTKSLKPLRFLKDVYRLDLSPYDFVINDFEPIAAYACKWRYPRKPCIALSHQAAFHSSQIPRPNRKSYFAEFLFKHFAPATDHIGFHFQDYDNGVYTPVIRSDIRSLELNYLAQEVIIYLPSYTGQFLLEMLQPIRGYQFRIFSKHDKTERHEGHVHIYPVDKDNWMHMLAKCPSAIMGAGFQGVSEMLFLKKKILAIPMANQYEQLCNAEALTRMGVSVLQEVDERFTDRVRGWLHSGDTVDINYPDHTEMIVRKALRLD